nr:MAG TPA: hypothetical protein [Caudoviricetes sp.]
MPNLFYFLLVFLLNYLTVNLIEIHLVTLFVLVFV